MNSIRLSMLIKEKGTYVRRPRTSIPSRSQTCCSRTQQIQHVQLPGWTLPRSFLTILWDEIEFVATLLEYRELDLQKELFSKILREF